MSKLKEMLTEVENRLGSILNGVVVNEKGYLEYREKAPRYSKWSFSYRERLEKEILKHYLSIDEIKTLIAREITIATSEGQPTSRLTSLYNKLPINKPNKEEEWVWCTECGKEKVYDGTICNSCKEWLVK